MEGQFWEGRQSLLHSGKVISRGLSHVDGKRLREQNQRKGLFISETMKIEMPFHPVRGAFQALTDRSESPSPAS